jgi:ankyrin repeat protein
MSRGEKSRKWKDCLRWGQRSNRKRNKLTTDNRPGAGSERSDGDCATPNSPTVKKVFDPWLEAQQLLRKDKTLDKIWVESIHILNSRVGLKSENDGNAIRVNDLRTFLNVTTERLDDKKWTIQDDIGQDDKRKKLTKVCQNILLVKDIVNSAAAASPPAAIACAGITAGLLVNPSIHVLSALLIFQQLFIQAMEQHESLLRGFDSIASLLPRLHVIEQHFLLRETGLSAELRRSLERNVIVLCAKVLEFQSRAVCYLGKPTAKQLLKDLSKHDGWDGILEDIERYDTYIKDTISSARDFNVDSQLNALQDKVQQIQVWQTISEKDTKRANLFQRLYTCPYKDRKDINGKRVPGTCEWFTSHPQFTRWNESVHSELLWVSAEPGCGKSVLTRYLADEYLPSGTRTVCYFFFKDGYQDQTRATNALASILRQLLFAQPHLVQDSLLGKSETSGNQLVESFNELWNMFLHVTADVNAGEVIILLDALDECFEDDRRNLIQAIERLFLNNPGERNLKFLMTSRPYDHIRLDFFKLEKSLPTIRLSGEDEENIETISSEIDLVITERVRDLSDKFNLTGRERDFITDQLTSVDNRTYLWVSLTLDVLERTPGLTEGAFDRVVHDIPKDIDAAYTKMLDRSPDHGAARKLLHIVTAAERPLTLEEISLALAVKAADQSIDDIKKELPANEEPEKTMAREKTRIRELCGLFLVVIDRKVYLFHQTAREFLVKKPASGDTGAGRWKHSLSPEKSHYVLAEICTLYLSRIFDPLPRFMDYAAKFWAVHFRRAAVSREDPIAKRGRMLCRQGSVVCKKWAAVYKSSRITFPDSNDTLIASSLGLTAIVETLLETGDMDVDFKDSVYGRTPLSWAAQYGHEGVVKLLLDTGRVDVESKDSVYGRTPLSWAAQNGHEGVVKLLLDTRRVDMETKGSDGRTPLSWAVTSGQEGVVKLLLDTGRVDMETKGSDGRTPLSWAVTSGQEGVIKLLLDTGRVDVESKSKSGRTPLSCAAEYGYEGIVKLLLDTGRVDMETKGYDGRTPLSWAARYGYEGIVKLLLDTGRVDVKTKDSEYGRTPLSWAAQYGYEGVVKLLLDTGRVDIESKDSEYGQTPLSWAAMSGQEGVIKLLLDTGRVDVETKGSDGRTPLSWAIMSGQKGVVKLLLDTGRVDVESKSKSGRTPLSWAVWYGYKGIVKLLLDTGRVDIESKDSEYGRTPLSWAVTSGQEGVVKLLLDTGRVDIETKGSDGRTPLSWAVTSGQEGVVRLLLDTGRVDVESKDSVYGRTPLSWAARYGYEGIVKLLLDTGRVDVKTKDYAYGQTPLSCAAEYGYEEIVKLLLDTGRVDVKTKGSDGGTPLSLAAENGHEGVVKLLRRANLGNRDCVSERSS